MDQLIPVRAILFPADGRQPSVVQVMTSPTQFGAQPGPCMPHPEAYMDFIAEPSSLGGAKPWKFFIVYSLDGMNGKFSHPYIVYYPTVSRDGKPFPINKSIRNIQDANFCEQNAWRGNVIIGKFHDHDHPFYSLMDASMADFPIMKNFIRSQASPARVQY